jgi:membrane dipeptidase
MGIHAKFEGYKSYQYLKGPKDYREFELVEGEGLFPQYLLPLSPQKEKRVQELAERTMIISLHEHPHLMPKDIRLCPEYDKQGRTVTGYSALADSYWDALFDNFQDGSAIITSKNGWKWTDVIHDVGIRLCDLAHQELVIKAETVGDIYRAHETGKIALIAAQEGAAMIENELERIEILYGIGLREMGITYSESNSLGTGLKEKNDGGLTSFGRRAVERMNEVGMAIDCAHASPQTTLDTIEVSTKPIFLTHIGARSVWDIKRLASDEVLKACAGKGGVIGIEAAPHTTMSTKRKGHDLETYMEHFEYIRDLVGIDHVAFGPDTLYGDHVGVHHVYSDALSISASHEGNSPAYEEVEYVKGLENPTEASKNILRWLVEHDYRDGDIKKVLGENILRVLKDVWQ